MTARMHDKSQAKEERISHVIEIAKKLFIEQGYSATTTAQIAREAEIAELTLFRYFSTKHNLFEAVIQPLVDFEESTVDLVHREPLHCRDLFNLIEKRVRFAQEEPELVRLVITESRLQPDLTGELNPISNVEKHIRGILLCKELSNDNCTLIIQLIKGLLLSIAFTPGLERQTIVSMVAMTESQILKLLKEKDKCLDLNQDEHSS